MPSWASAASCVAKRHGASARLQRGFDPIPYLRICLVVFENLEHCDAGHVMGNRFMPSKKTLPPGALA